MARHPRPTTPPPVDPAGPLEDLLRTAVGWAILAPSPHNTQPWRWTVTGERVELRADRSRQLPVCDPDGRELVIGCGAALETLLLVLTHAGVSWSVATGATAADRDLLAVVAAHADPGSAERDEPALVAAVPQRRTNRRRYRPEPLPDGLAEQLAAEASARCPGIHLRWLDAGERGAVTDLVAACDRSQMADRPFRHELAAWMRRPGQHTGDGMSAAVLDRHGLAALVAPAVVRAVDVGRSQAERDRVLLESSPGVAVVWSEDDTEPTWLGVGRALARITLRAQAAGIRSAHMNQPCEVPAAREELRGLLGIPGPPQLVLRLGSTDPSPPSARRPLPDVLDVG